MKKNRSSKLVYFIVQTLNRAIEKFYSQQKVNATHIHTIQKRILLIISLIFFTVELVDGKVFATPIDDSGILNPITMNLVDPFQYYKERAEGKN